MIIIDKRTLWRAIWGIVFTYCSFAVIVRSGYVRHLLGLEPTKIDFLDKRDFVLLSDTAVIRTTSAGRPLPLGFSRRSKMPAVRDQGLAPTCTEFSLCYALGSVKYKSDFSPAYIGAFVRFYVFLDSLAKLHDYRGDYGRIALRAMPRKIRPLSVGKIGSGLEILRVHGACFEYQHPYKPENLKRLPSARIRKSAQRNRIYDWGCFYVGSLALQANKPLKPISGYSGVNKARILLSQGRPVIANISVSDSIYNFERTGTVFSFTEAQDFNPYNHAVCLVGYNDTVKTADGQGVFYVINSWGTGLQVDGYITISYQEMVRHQYENVFYWFVFSKKEYDDVMQSLDLK